MSAFVTADLTQPKAVCVYKFVCFCGARVGGGVTLPGMTPTTKKNQTGWQRRGSARDAAAAPPGNSENERSGKEFLQMCVRTVSPARLGCENVRGARGEASLCKPHPHGGRKKAMLEVTDTCER